MAALEKYFSPAQIARAREMAERAVGQPITIRVDRSTKVVGVVDSAEPAYAGFSARAAHVVWSVDVLCGVNKTRRNFKLQTLPQ